MPAEKRNAFLDAGDSEDDIGGHESDDDVRKGSAKRRRIESDDDLSDGDHDDAASVDNSDQTGRDPRFQIFDDDAASKPASEDEDASKSKKQKLDELPGVSRPLTKKNLVATEAAIKRSGVIYISRVPPCKSLLCDNLSVYRES